MTSSPEVSQPGVPTPVLQATGGGLGGQIKTWGPLGAALVAILTSWQTMGATLKEVQVRSAANAEAVRELRKEDLADLQKSLATTQNVIGAMQLDIALICSELVKQRGGNPAVECRTSRGIR